MKNISLIETKELHVHVRTSGRAHIHTQTHTHAPQVHTHTNKHKHIHENSENLYSALWRLTAAENNFWLFFKKTSDQHAIMSFTLNKNFTFYHFTKIWKKSSYLGGSQKVHPT